MKDVKDWEVSMSSDGRVVQSLCLLTTHSRIRTRLLSLMRTGGEDGVPQHEVPSYGQHRGAVICIVQVLRFMYSIHHHIVWKQWILLRTASSVRATCFCLHLSNLHQASFTNAVCGQREGRLSGSRVMRRGLRQEMRPAPGACGNAMSGHTCLMREVHIFTGARTGRRGKMGRSGVKCFAFVPSARRQRSLESD